MNTRTGLAPRTLSVQGDELPYKAEYAKSGRASCKACSGAISKDSLRLAIMIQVMTSI